jgi:uncharacterized protein (DUF1015 family)
MAEIRPFRALRYNPSVAGDPADLVAPPYDVVAGQQRLDLYQRSAYNVARIDYGEDRPDLAGRDHYSEVARELKQWRSDGALLREEQPRLYLYEQEFLLDGDVRRRRCVFAALRLEEWEKGIVLPHEVTGASAKLDRLRLLRATRTYLSPVMALYKPEGVSGLLDATSVEAPVLDAVLSGERHILSPLRADAADAFANALAGQKLYVADGHHRYETALNYRDECRAAASSWTGEEAENFVLVGMIAADDPGFVVLPTHRLLRLPSRDADLSLRLAHLFDIEELGPATPESVQDLESRMVEEGHDSSVFGAIGLQPGQLHMLRPRDFEAVVARTPADHTPAWRRLDVTLLAYAVLPDIGYDGSPEHIDYTEDGVHALRAVESGGWDAALLINPTPIEQVIEVSESGDRMPRKSTYFYPKLATGVVLLPLD